MISLATKATAAGRASATANTRMNVLTEANMKARSSKVRSESGPQSFRVGVSGCGCWPDNLAQNAATSCRDPLKSR